MPSTRALAVLNEFAYVIDATTPGQDSLPTPCTEFDVLALRRHVLGGVQYFTAALAAPATDQRPDPRTYVGPDDPGAVAKAMTQLVEVASLALANEIDTKLVNVPQLAGGPLPGRQLLGLLLAEAVVHGWDYCRATGQAWQPDSAASEQAHAALAVAIRPEWRGADGMPFAPETPVSADAPALDRLIAFTGRPVKWQPAVRYW